jgi:hypothetical protein
MTKKALKEAAAKFAALKTAGATPEELIDAIAADPAGYKGEDIDAIVAALSEGTSNGPGNPAPAAETKNQDFEEWTVSPKYKTLRDKFSGKEISELQGFEKERKIRDLVRITPDRAELENAQSEQTLVRLYPKK